MIALDRLKYYLSRAQGTPTNKLAERIARRAWDEAVGFAGEFKARALPQSRHGSDQAAAAPAYWRGQPPKGLFLSRQEWNMRCQALAQADATAKSLIVAEADRLCSHSFDLLGSGDYRFGEKIDWHLDWKTGHHFNQKTYYKRVHPAAYPGGFDIKVPWELSRCHHLVRLGQAWRLTADEKYARELLVQVEDWIDNNPHPFGVNWASTMEVAIRAVNWLWGLALVIDSPSVSDEFLLELAQSLIVHGEHIIHNLETPTDGRYADNHYFANLVGLVYLGVCCPFLPQAKAWLAFGVSELWRETQRQVYLDGVDAEGSVPYHRLVTEMLVSAILLCKKSQVAVPQDVMERAEKMLEFVALYIEPNGTVPMIGDQDNGRLHRLGVWAEPEREWIDHSYLLTIGRHLFPSNEHFKHAANDCQTVWLIGADAIREADLPHSQMTSRAFALGGLYVTRCQEHYLILRTAGSRANGSSAHTHNDIFSFELAAFDKTFIVDPGTFSYTSDVPTRNTFRSSRYHNVLVVDGQEINPIPPYEPFRMGNLACVAVNRWESNPDHDLFEAEHTGYQRLTNPAQHRRAVYFDKHAGFWIIRDDALGRGKHQLELYFHFAPIEVEQAAASPLIWTHSEGANLALWFAGMRSESVTMEQGWVSPSYGVKIKAPIVKCNVQVELPFTFLTVLYPSKSRSAGWAGRVPSLVAEHPWFAAARNA